MLRPDPVRRVLAVDAGSRRLKLMLVKGSFGRGEILREESVDLHEEGLVNTEELKTHLHDILEDCGRPPIALTLSQHLSTSQIIELPQTPESEVRRLIEDEIIRLSGVSDSAIVHDFVQVKSPAAARQQFWVTLCKERDIEERVQQLGLAADDLCDVTTAANALVAAYRAAEPQPTDALLVHLGAQNTLLVVLDGGHAVFATSFTVGSDSFTRAVAKARNCSFEEAEPFKRRHNVLTGPQALPGFAEFVDGWVAEIKRQFSDWFTSRSRPLVDISTVPVIVGGAAFDQPGLLEYLNQRVALSLRPWPVRPGLPAPGFEIAYGTALQALNLTDQPVSLLPAARRAAWKRRLTTRKIELANVALITLCFLALCLGVWQKLSLLERKRELLTKVQAGADAMQANQSLTATLLLDYEQLRPMFECQQNTVDALATLALLQESRSNRTFWYVLLADQQSYFTTGGFTVTNRPGRTNGSIPFIGPLPPAEHDSLTGGIGSEFSPAKPGLIAELCVPEDVEGARRVLSQVVNDLKQSPLFTKVDLLSDDLRRDYADPKVILPGRHFALALDFAAADFHQPQVSRRFRQSDAFGGPGRSGRRTLPASPDGSESGKTP